MYSSGHCFTKCRYCKQKRHITKGCPKLRSKGNRLHHVENEDDLLEPVTGLKPDFGFTDPNEVKWIMHVDTTVKVCCVMLVQSNVTVKRLAIFVFLLVIHCMVKFTSTDSVMNNSVEVCTVSLSV